MFKAGVHELTKTKESPKDPKAVGTSCFIAAAIYLLFIIFCSCQVCLLKIKLKIYIKRNHYLRVLLIKQLIFIIILFYKINRLLLPRRLRNQKNSVPLHKLFNLRNITN